ncbi:MAG: dihydrofolate reductase [Candidatus Aenigmarchaeota archaeon]|nr:dihydrofolate reductase [Candidatus Aenigmarchaeota archaeon]
MRVSLYMAMSANGIIARENYDEDFLSHRNWEVFCKLAENIGCFIIGRKTYEVVKKWKDYNFDSVKAKKIVVSKNMNFELDSGYTPAKSPKDAISKASAMGFKKVLLTGGSGINSAFMKDGLVDEILLNIEPVVLGKGIRLFAEDNFDSRLKLINTRKLPKDIIQLHYKVKKSK